MAAQREWFEKDYYKILGVAESASQKEVTKAYRKLARENHPDANPGDAAAEERFKEVSAAYDVIGDATKREEYDEVRRLGPMAGGFGGGGPGPTGAGGFGGPGGFTFTTDDVGDLGDLLGGLFNRGGRGRRGGGASGRGTGPQRGADLEAELHMSFEDAVRGITTTLELASEATCTACRGTGGRDGTAVHTCPTCSGRGVVDDNQGLFSFSSPCRACAGRGTIIDDPCPVCSGSGSTYRTREVKVRIPAGVDDGQRIRLKGRGAPGRHGGPAGDLYVTVHVEAHPTFGRSGKNLTLRVPVTFAEAALGADIRVPTLDGDAVTLRLPAGTRSGRTFRVKGRGVAGGRSPGDLLVTVEVAVPAQLTEAQRRAVEALAEASEESPRAHLGV